MRKHARSLVNILREIVEDSTAEDIMWGCEVGVWRGHTSAALLKSFPNLYLSAVDPWELGAFNPTMVREMQELRKAHEEFCQLTDPFNPRVTILQMTSLEAASVCQDQSLDFVFIDGVHTYDHVCQDLRAWQPKVASGGVLSGHDYGGVGDRRGVFGVKRAVDEWAGEQKLSVYVAAGNVWWVQL
jgi:hypothetical protein